MFRAPAASAIVPVAPTLKGLDSFLLYHTYSAPWDLYRIMTGYKIHFPNCTVSGSKLYYGGKEVRFWFGSIVYLASPVVGSSSAEVIDPSSYPATFSLGTDANGAYLEMIGDWTHRNDNYSPNTYDHGDFIFALVFPENPYSTWPYGPMPPAYYTTPIS